MAFEIDLPVRFDDVDAAGVVYYPRLLDMCHLAFEDLFSARGPVPYHELFIDQKIGFPTRSVEAEFHSPVEYQGHITIRLSTYEIGLRSVRFLFEGTQNGVNCFSAKIGKVCCTLGPGNKFEVIEIPESVRKMLASLESAS